MTEVIDQVNAQLKQVKLRAVVSGRPKHYYSIYEKMVVQGKEFTDIFDLVGVRILVDSIKDCYAALGQVHAVWKPVPGRFKDYIAMPKFNLYQSLHTTVVGPQGKPLEIQIRTKAMHRTAEYGVAAHWRYKSKDGKPATEQEMGWLAADRLAAGAVGPALHREPRPTCTSTRCSCSPQGRRDPAPGRATLIDFAYAVHTEVGHRCVGARVNKRLVPAGARPGERRQRRDLHLQGPGRRPSRDWLGIVKTPRPATSPPVVRQGAARGRHRGRDGPWSGPCARPACCRS